MKNKKSFIKKIREKGPESLPRARAARLKRLRNMANLTRKEICDKHNLNINTYKGWEIGRFGGLPLDMAKRIINRVAEENIICSLDWLLHGEGIGPTTTIISNDFNKDQSNTGILQEILLYKSLSQNVIFTEVIDDGMSPLYNNGDYVAGKKENADNIDKLLNQNCIAQLDNDEIVVRKLKEGSEKGRYTLICTNTDTSIKQPTLYNIKLKCAAYIARHYKT